MKICISLIRAMLCLIFQDTRRRWLPGPAGILPALLLSFPGVQGQPNGEGTPSPAGYAAITPLEVGDTMQPLQMDTYWPSPATVRLPMAGPNTLTLIYFWHTTCTSCWFKFPLLDSLQYQFGDKLKIVTVTRQKEDVVKAFQLKQAKTKGISLIGIHADTLLEQMFPFLFVSHVAWVEGSGRVVAITGPGLITASNITKTLAGQVIDLPVKRDISFFKPASSLFQFNTKGGYNIEPTNISYTAWAGHLPGVESGVYLQNNDSVRRITAINNSLRQLFTRVFQLPPFPSQIRVPNAWKTTFSKSDDISTEEWLPQHSWCFEMVLSGKLSKKVQEQRMLNAIEQHFGITARLDTLNIPCRIVEGAGKPDGAYRAQQYLYMYNEKVTEFVLDATDADTRLSTPPEPEKLPDKASFARWCAANGLTVRQSACRVPVFTIQTIQ